MMFDNIAQLENEVREFEKNILASKDLLTRLDTLISEVGKGEKTIAEQSAVLNRTIDEKNTAAVNELKMATQGIADSNTELETKIKDTISRLQTTVQDDNAGKLAEMSKLLTDGVQEIQNSAKVLEDNLERQNNTAIKYAVNCVESTLTTYSKQLGETLDHMESLKRELVSEYQDFTAKLSDSNIDQVYERINALEKSISKKITLLMTGIGVVAIIGIVSIFL